MPQRSRPRCGHPRRAAYALDLTGSRRAHSPRDDHLMSSVERNTLRGSPVVVAPGKIFLIGEYAVIDGAPAVVAAVSRVAVGQFVPAFEPESPFVAEAVQAALSGIGDHAAALPPGSVMIDSRAFSLNGKKLGLGSSAAVTTA